MFSVTTFKNHSFIFLWSLFILLSTQKAFLIWILFVFILGNSQPFSLEIVFTPFFIFSPSSICNTYTLDFLNLLSPNYLILYISLCSVVPVHHSLLISFQSSFQYICFPVISITILRSSKNLNVNFNTLLVSLSLILILLSPVLFNVLIPSFIF